MAGPRRARKLWVWMLIAAVLAAAYVAAGRIAVERSSIAVELVIDYDAAVQLCRAAGYPLDTFMRRAKLAGLTSVALNERTISDMVEKGEARTFTGRQILDYDRLARVTDPVLRQMIDEGRLFGSNTYLFAQDASVYNELVPLLDVRLSGERVSMFNSPRLGPFIETARGIRDLESVNLGLDPAEVREAKNVGLAVVARFRNYPGVTPEKVRFFADRLAEIDGARLIIFEGQEALGYPAYLAEAADKLSSHGLAFGYVEFAVQKGDNAFARMMSPRVVRVHSITEREMDKIPFDKAVERFVRAARERGIRVMYIRPFPATAGSGISAINHNLDYIEAIADGLAASGFTLGQAEPLKPYAPHEFYLVVMAAGIMAGAFILLDKVVQVPPVLELGLFALGLIAYTASLFTRLSALSREAAALGAAIVFPALAVDLIMARSWRSKSLASGTGLSGGGCLWLEASGISVIGGFLLAGTLSSTSFMLRLDQFAGIKVAHVLPLLIVGILCWRYWAAQRRADQGFVATIGDLLAEPIRVWHALALAVVVAAGLVYILRTGNVYFGIPLPALDEGMRVFLEKVLVFRPRTKEFLIGHPALMLAAAAMLRGDRRLGLPLALAGCIGQISMVNTFSHLHTPLLATLLRTLYGLVIGGAIGAGLSAAYFHFTEGRRERVASATEGDGIDG